MTIEDVRQVVFASIAFLCFSSLAYSQQVALPTAETSPAATADFVVAADGSGDFLRVQDAIEAAPANSSTRAVIFLKPGIYKETLRVPSSRKNLSLIGES